MLTEFLTDIAKSVNDNNSLVVTVKILASVLASFPGLGIGNEATRMCAWSNEIVSLQRCYIDAI